MNEQPAQPVKNLSVRIRREPSGEIKRASRAGQDSKHKSRNATYAYADTPLKVEPPISVADDPLLLALKEGKR